MSNKKEKIQNEVIRMLQLSEFRNQKKTVISKDDNITKKVIKEDFINDLNYAFENEEYFSKDFLETNVGKVPELTDEMKAAMLCHSFTEMQAVLLGLYEKYNPDYSIKTLPAKAGQDKETYFDKKSSTKIKGEIPQDDLKRFKSTEKNDDIEKVRIPATFIDSQENLENITAKKAKALQKWWSDKSMYIISYNFSNRKLTDLGKAQLQFLARAATMKPEGDFEKTLFDIFGEPNYEQVFNEDTNELGRYHFRQTAEKILRQFYSHVCIPYIMELTHRAKYNPNDSQLHIFIEKALSQVFDAMQTQYDALRGNIGTFIITGVKNNVKNQLRDISDLKLDASETQNILYNHEGPITIQSTANPKDVSGEFDKSFDTLKTTKGGKKIYGYVYNNPQMAWYDLSKDARNTEEKPSPLSKRFLIGSELQKYYKSFPPGTFEDVKTGMNYQDVDPYETQSIFKVETLPQEAKSTIFEILNQIADVMITDVGKQNKKLDTDYDADYNYISKNVVPLLKNNKQTFIELMYELLGFGDMVEVYTKVWEVQNKQGKTTKKPIGSPVMYTTNESGEKVPVENINGEIPGIGDTQTVWSSGSISEEEVKQKFVEKFLNKIAAKPGQTEERELINIFQQNPKEANAIISAIRNGLKKFFGFEGLNVPVLQKNRNKLNNIIKNYEASMLAENKARNLIKLFLKNKLQ